MMTLHDLEAVSKVEFDTCKRFAEVVFSFQTPRTNDKEDVRVI